MQLSEKITIDIDKIAIEKNIMTIAVIIESAASGKKNTDIRLAVRFENRTESRILPLSITDVAFDESGCYLGYAIFEYSLDDVFLNRDLNEFTVTVQAYDGEKYQNVIVQNDKFNQLKKDCEYVCTPLDGVITLKRCKPQKNYNKNSLIRFFCLIYRLVELIIGTLLLPLFILDGIYVYVLGYKRKNGEQTYDGSRLKKILLFAKWRYSSFCRFSMNWEGIKETFLNLMSVLLSPFFKKKGILFVSTRREDLTGNISFVNDVLKEKNADISFWLKAGGTRHMTYRSLLDLAYKLAKSKVVVVDDYTPVLNDVWVMRKRKLVQLWHACGAFKTFGFSRIGKEGGPDQTDINHRYYDYAIVSSSEICRFYAEGFGIDERKVKALGVPRTDVFFDEEYKKNIRQKLYNEYPQLKDKKVILFAPTFRGNGANSAYYPFEKFDAEEFLNKIPDDYILIIKHHPFVREMHPVGDGVKDRVLDLSKDSEINDLLFITDVLITDYSSVIFEASLLDIPMLFYAYDLENYIVSRDFYYPYREFVPGKIVRDSDKLSEAVRKNDYVSDKTEKFKHRFFDELDGKSSERVAEFILQLSD